MNGSLPERSQPGQALLSESVPAGLTWRKREEWLREAHAVEERRRFQPAAAGWLAGWPWDWIGHLTFDPKRAPVGRDGSSLGHRLEYCQRQVRAMLREVSREVWGRRWPERGKGVFAFIAFERHRDGRWHAHVLVGGTRRSDGRMAHRFVVMRKWEERAGFAEIFLVDSGEVAARYVSKYVTKAPRSWEVFGTWIRQAVRPEPSLW